MAVDPVRPQALLHGLRRDLHRQFIPMRDRTIARNADSVSCYPGRRRRRFAAGIAGNLAGHFSARTVGYRVCRLWNGDRARAGDRAYDRRLDHGQLSMALDLLYECAGWDPLAAAGIPLDRRSRLYPQPTQEAARAHEHRLHRNRPPRALLGRSAGCARQGSGRQLVLLAADSKPWA
jgi:hypothetical protein